MEKYTIHITNEKKQTCGLKTFLAEWNTLCSASDAFMQVILNAIDDAELENERTDNE